MAKSSDEDYELKILKRSAEDIKRLFKPYEIDVMIRIYRWTKSERNRYFFTHILKRLPNYAKAVKKLRSNGFIMLVKSRDPHKITEDGIRVGGLMLQLKDMSFL